MEGTTTSTNLYFNWDRDTSLYKSRETGLSLFSHYHFPLFLTPSPGHTVFVNLMAHKGGGPHFPLHSHSTRGRFLPGVTPFSPGKWVLSEKNCFLVPSCDRRPLSPSRRRRVADNAQTIEIDGTICAGGKEINKYDIWGFQWRRYCWHK